MKTPSSLPLKRKRKKRSRLEKMTKIIMLCPICVLVLILLGLIASGRCEIDCTTAPVENLAPCGPYLSGSTSNPTHECCSGAASWENYGSDLCGCFKTWPREPPYPLNPNKIAKLRFECGLSDRYADIVCCIL